MKRFISTFIACIIAIGSMAMIAHVYTEAAVGAPAPVETAVAAVSPSPSSAATGSAATVATPATAAASAETAKSAPAPSGIPATYPARLSIPAIGVDAAIQQTGITAKGDIGSPSNFTDAAWYEYSAIPGQPGGSIIDGHVDNGLGLAGVFKHLSDVRTGDSVYVTTRGGKMLRFTVTAVNSYGYASVPVASLLDASGTRLSLITCTGDWVADQKTYDQRIVITAVLQAS